MGKGTPKTPKAKAKAKQARRTPMKKAPPAMKAVPAPKQEDVKEDIGFKKLFLPIGARRMSRAKSKVKSKEDGPQTQLWASTSVRAVRELLG